MEVPGVVDFRAPTNQVAYATTEEEVYALLVARYGLSELLAMGDDPVVRQYVGAAPDRWRRTAEFLQTRAVHELRAPTMQEQPFVPVERKFASDTVCAPVGLSPTSGYAAVLTGNSERPRLWVRRVVDAERTSWHRHRGTKTLPRIRLATVWGEHATLVAANAVLVVHMADTRAPPREFNFAETVVCAVSDGHRLIVAYADGTLEIIGPTGVCSGRRQLRLSTTQAPPPSPVAFNPASGEPLDAPAPTVVDVTYHVVRIAFNQLAADRIAVSTREGFVALMRLDDEHGLVHESTLAMGPEPSLEENPPLEHPPQETATFLCFRQAPVVGASAVLAQCGHHLSYREAGQIDMHAPIFPRYPLAFLPDVGPLRCVGVCGTTIVAHSVINNIVAVGSLVPDHDQLEQSMIRYRVRTNTTHPLLNMLDGYSSLCVTPTVIYALQPDGSVTVLEPTGKPWQRL